MSGSMAKKQQDETADEIERLYELPEIGRLCDMDVGPEIVSALVRRMHLELELARMQVMDSVRRVGGQGLYEKVCNDNGPRRTNSTTALKVPQR